MQNELAGLSRVLSWRNCAMRKAHRAKRKEEERIEEADESFVHSVLRALVDGN